MFEDDDEAFRDRRAGYKACPITSMRRVLSARRFACGYQTNPPLKAQIQVSGGGQISWVRDGVVVREDASCLGCVLR